MSEEFLTDAVLQKFYDKYRPELGKLRAQYKSSDAKGENSLTGEGVFTNPELRNKSVKDFVDQKRLNLFRDNASDVLQDIQKSTDAYQADIKAKLSQKGQSDRDASYGDVRKMLGMPSPTIDMSAYNVNGAFDKAAQGSSTSVTVGIDNDVTVKQSIRVISPTSPMGTFKP